MACRRERTADGGDKKWKLFDREPPSHTIFARARARTHPPRIAIHTRYAEKDGGEKAECSFEADGTTKRGRGVARQGVHCDGRRQEGGRGGGDGGG